MSSSALYFCLMNVLRCVGLSIVVLLSACDAQQDPAPKPKVSVEAAPQSQSAATPATGQSVGAAKSESAKTPVHELTPNVPVVPVTAKAEGAPAASKPDKSSTAKVPAKSASESKREATTRKSVAESKKALKETSLGNAKLDLSLPPELAEELQPTGTTTVKPRKPLLPPMFGDKDDSADRGPFELNGRILSNEMQLQMRNENRRDVEGAALDFKFRQ